MSLTQVFPFPLTIPTFSHFSTNFSLISSITPSTINAPFYHTSAQDLLPWLSDRHLSLAAPILAYWITSLMFHALDNLKLPYFEARRIHESPEVLARNMTTVGEVVRAVCFQHFVQILLGLMWLEDDRNMSYQDHLYQMSKLAPGVVDVTLLALGRNSGEKVLRLYGSDLVRWVYWWGIPTAQMFLAFFVMDSWQYFLHRAFHTSRFLYRHVHSVHHKLYVPYAFGALYNHPLEGFLFDSLGATVSQYLAGMSIRQTIVLFTFSSIKTVDDHCGYRLWWDPCQLFFYNNVDYHDIHHQVYGIKANYSQPFFTNWDVLLGTRMTREEANAKTRPRSKVVEKIVKVE